MFAVLILISCVSNSTIFLLVSLFSQLCLIFSDLWYWSFAVFNRFATLMFAVLILISCVSNSAIFLLVFLFLQLCLINYCIFLLQFDKFSDHRIRR